MKFKNYFIVSSVLAISLLNSANALACHKGETCVNGKPVPTIGGKTASQILDELNQKNKTKKTATTLKTEKVKVEKVKIESSDFKAPHKGSTKKK
ncbi:MAG: hypothetical protein AABZ74_16350 [Cyanobacteriota bacterium]